MLRPRISTNAVANSLFLFFSIAFFLMSDRDVVDDPGLGWHLRIADQMWESQSFQYSEEFCFPSIGKPWVTYAWLSDIALRMCYEWGGLNAMGIVTALTFALVLRILFIRMIGEDVPWLTALMWTCLAAIAVLPFLSTRPNMFTFVGLTLTAAVCERFHCGAISRKQTLWLLPIFLVWVNAHSGFLSGALVLMTTYIVEFLLSVFGSANQRQSARVRFAWWTKLGCVLLLITLVNPYGVNLYLHLVNTVTDPWIQRGTTTEWRPPDFRERGWWLLESMVLLLPLLCVASRKKPSAVSLALCLVFLHFALTGVRYTGLWVVIAIPTLAQLSCDIPWLDPLKDWLTRNTSSEFRNRFTNGSRTISPLPSLACAVLFLGVSPWLPSVTAHDPARMPTKALAHVLEISQGERVFHSPNWGGYLTWHGWNLEPRFKTFLDDRLDIHGADLLADYYSIARAEIDWRERLEAHGINVLCLEADAPLVEYARVDPLWTETYLDTHVVVFRREGVSFGVRNP